MSRRWYETSHLAQRLGEQGRIDPVTRRQPVRAVTQQTDGETLAMPYANTTGLLHRWYLQRLAALEEGIREVGFAIGDLRQRPGYGCGIEIRERHGRNCATSLAAGGGEIIGS